jgi:hypothetical protein
MDHLSPIILKRRFNEQAFLKESHSTRILIETLNTPEESEPEEVRARLRELKATLLSLSELQRKSLNRELFHPDELKPINETLARYKWITQYVVADVGAEDGGPDLVLYSQSEPADGAVSVDDAIGLSRLRIQRLSEWIVELAKADLLDLVRRCGYCQRWFFAKSRYRGFFCTPQHQQAAHKSTPEFKEKAREYQKQYYRDILSPVTGRWKKRKRKRGKLS